MKFTVYKQIRFYYRVGLNKSLVPEIALEPTQFTQKMLIAQPIYRENLNYLLHPLYLYSAKVIPFDYDYYQWACTMMPDHQRAIQVQDILMIMKLGKQYQVDNALLWKHFQNELLWRIKQGAWKKVQKDQKMLQQSLGNIFKTLQEKSKDVFQILTEEEMNKQQNQEQQTENSQVVERQLANQKYQKKIRSLIMQQKRSSPINSTKELIQFSELLVWHNCQNRELLVCIVQTLTLELKKLQNAQIITYLRLLTHLCIVLMKEYRENSVEYTARSIKNIYKLQSFYYEEITPVLEDKIPQFNQQNIREVITQMGSFPVKKRKFRKAIGLRLIQRFQSLSLQEQELRTALVSISGKDHKMIQSMTKEIESKRSKKATQIDNS